MIDLLNTAGKLLLATGNAHKVDEFRAIFASNGLDNIQLLSFTELGVSCDPAEDGSTFRENALIKAREAARLIGIPAIADDSGLEVDALGGAPGIYSARYSPQKSSEGNIQKLLYNLSGVPWQDRAARFVCEICLYFSEEKMFFSRGECEGIILEEPDGDGGFGYDPVFYSTECKKSFAALSAAEKNRISHRGRAIKALCEHLKRI